MAFYLFAPDCGAKAAGTIITQGIEKATVNFERCDFTRVSQTVQKIRVGFFCVIDYNQHIIICGVS
jgi:hypothetical protein